MHDIVRKPSLAKICALQLEVAKLPQVEFEPEHYFAPGMYVRKLEIPKGVLVVGKMHRHEHVAFLLEGTATVITDTGKVKMKAPYIWISPAGAKRVVWTHNRCVFATAHATTETDLDKIEDFVIIPEREYMDDVGSSRISGDFRDKLDICGTERAKSG